MRILSSIEISIYQQFSSMLGNYLETYNGSYQGKEYVETEASKTFREKGIFKYIPVSLEYFYASILKVRFSMQQMKMDLARPKFVDYGCGAGITLLIAKCMDWEVTGYEIRDEVIRLARNIVSGTILKADLEEPSLYVKEKWDVVYFYRPFTNDAKQKKFESRAILSLKKGGFLIPYGTTIKNESLIFLGEDVYQKK